MSATGRSGFGKAAAGAPDGARKSCAALAIVNAAAKTIATVIRIKSPAHRARAAIFARNRCIMRCPTHNRFIGGAGAIVDAPSRSKYLEQFLAFEGIVERKALTPGGNDALVLYGIPSLPVVLDHHVLAFDVAGFVEAFSERSGVPRGVLGRSAVDDADNRHRWLLRARRERPRRCCTSDERDDLATVSR